MKITKTTTNKHFEIFKTEAEYWIDYLGLKSWEIDFYHRECDGSMAQLWFNSLSRHAALYLAVKWTQPVTEKELRMSAFHEATELLLGILSEYADGKLSHTANDTERETHAIVRTLENTMFKDRVRN